MSLQILFSKQLEIDYTNDSQIDCKVLTKQRFQNFFLFDNAKIKEYIYLNPTYTRTFYLENSRSKAYKRSILQTWQFVDDAILKSRYIKLIKLCIQSVNEISSLNNTAIYLYIICC